MHRRLMTSVVMETKRACKRIGTHNGSFHCDEALACYMLKKLPEYKDAEIVRTRDPATLESCDIVVDVGGVYDHSKKRYDHHQRTFTDSMSTVIPSTPWVTKLSSAGLVYAHYGRDVIDVIMRENSEAQNGEPLDVPKRDQTITTLYNKVYEKFVEAVDAVDNGISTCTCHEVQKPRYEVTTSLGSRVKKLNPEWNEPQDNIDERFLQAVKLTGSEFESCVKGFINTWLPAREFVVSAIQDRHKHDPSGEIMVLTSGGLPWKEHLFEMEQDMGVDPPIKFVLYTDQNGKWRVQCVPICSSSFENRLSLLERWRGVRDDQLSELSGIPGCIFVHASGFIGGNNTFEGALQMAKQTLKERDDAQ